MNKAKQVFVNRVATNAKFISPLEGESYMNDLMNEIVKGMVKTEDDLLKNILRKCLGKEPVPEDAKLLTIMKYEDRPNEYDIAFRDIVVGTVKTDYGNPFGADRDYTCKCTMTFIPKNNLLLSEQSSN
jgi:hypothetical protein